MSEIRYIQVVSGQLTIEKLPDGSTAILDQRTKNVHSLNASATVAWEACKNGATLAEVRRALELRAGAPINEAIAQDALVQLHQVKLVEADAAVPEVRNAARRSALLRAAAIAVPVVLTLGLAEQREFALYAASRGGGNSGP